jgi:hypothetical protein
MSHCTSVIIAAGNSQEEDWHSAWGGECFIRIQFEVLSSNVVSSTSWGPLVLYSIACEQEIELRALRQERTLLVNENPFVCVFH